MEDLRGLRHVEASNAAVEEGVEGDDVRRDVAVVLHFLQHGFIKL